MQQIFPVNENTVVEIRGHGNARLSGWDRPEVSVDIDPSALRVDQGQNALSITCVDDCEIFVPAATKVLVTKIGGDAHMTNLPGDFSIEKVGGNLTLQQIGAVSIHKVGGNCRVQIASGLVSIEKVGGNFDGLDLQRGLDLPSVGGNISATGVKATASARAGGNIYLSLEEVKDSAMQFRAGGDIRMQLPGITNGVFTLSSGGEDIQVTLAGRSERFSRKEYALSLGKGGADFTLRAGDSITVSDQPLSGGPSENFGKPGWEERLNERIRSRVEYSMNSAELSDRIDRTVTEALRRAQERVQAAMQRVEREWPEKEWGFTPSPVQPPVTPAPPEPPATPTTASDGVSDEERLLILRMLQEKKITVEQAEALMDELEEQDNEPETK